MAQEQRQLVPKDAIFKHTVPLRTRWKDLDNQQVLNNAVFMTLFEEARTDYFGPRLLNVLPSDWVFPFVLLKCDVRYLKPGKAPVDILVDIRTIQLGNSSFTQQYRVRESATGAIWSEAEATIVTFDFEKNKKMNIPEVFRRRVAEFEGISLTPAAPAEKKSKIPVETNYKEATEVLRIGHYAQMKKRFGPEEVLKFAELSEDFNALHLDEGFAKTTRFGRTIMHGQLFTSLISGLLGSTLPGKGTVYMAQNYKYRSPAFVGEEITARVEVRLIDPQRKTVTLLTTAQDSTGKELMTGEATVMVPIHKLTKDMQPSKL